jgi:hypothetical protein
VAGHAPPNVRIVYLRAKDETDAHGRRRAPSGVATPGGVFIWPNGYITCYTDQDGRQDEGVIYPPDAIEHLEFGPMALREMAIYLRTRQAMNPDVNARIVGEGETA